MSEVVANRPTATAADATYVRTANTHTRPKSKKELRAEKKASKKAAAAANANNDGITKKPSEGEIKKEEKQLLKKERRKQQLQERERERIREIRREKKDRQKKRKARELHAVGGGLDPIVAAKRLEERRNNKKRRKMEQKEQKEAASESKFFGHDNDMAVLDQVFHGVEDENGVRTLEMGVKCKDVTIGKGETVQNNSLVTVMYKLKSGKGILIDSSKKFMFRVGRGNVIRGWDIGVQGMRVGGTRKLIVPPKAGYGGQDIGAGPGALLYFDITALACCKMEQQDDN
mmetsp:Transcript_8511/g.18403  ORF Transcript_8511/g.18403 Transcript_8511/m.18403 type:complete len:287 (+) Transcript_8511:113-973(+)